MKRTVTAALLAASMALSLVLPAGASGSVPAQTQVAQVIQALGILAGDEAGNLNLEQQVTRAQFVTMALKASPNGERVGEASTSPYSDVPYTHWAAGFVEAGVQAGLISGYSDGTFRPDHTITLAEGVTIALNLLGYTPADFSGAYPSPQMALYYDLDLDQGLNVRNSGDVLTRHDAMYLFYNLLSAPSKGGQPYINSLGYQLNAAGEVDLVGLVNGQMSGPIVATGDWQSAIPFPVHQATVRRDGEAAQLSSVQTNDVVYWNTDLNTLWVYSEKASGTIQALQPSSSNPTSVQVGGRTYPIQTTAAAYALSDLGDYGVGDTVTLLLGRDGGVVSVAEPSAVSQFVCGVVIQTQLDTLPDGNTNQYMADTLTIFATDGNTYTYEYSPNYFEVGAIVGVSLSQDGQLEVKRLSSDLLYGRVDDDASHFAGVPFASNVEILDTYKGNVVKITPERLAGMELKSSVVGYHSLNGSGEITRLILRDATGDAYHYGILTNITEMATGAFLSSYTYQYIVDGQTYTLPNQAARYPVEPGPIVVKGDPSAPTTLQPMTKVKATAIQGDQLVVDHQSYTIWEDVAVYEKKDGKYYLSSLDRVLEQGLTLQGWYDRPQREGGRIRIMVAE